MPKCALAIRLLNSCQHLELGELGAADLDSWSVVLS